MWGYFKCKLQRLEKRVLTNIKQFTCMNRTASKEILDFTFTLLAPYRSDRMTFRKDTGLNRRYLKNKHPKRQLFLACVALFYSSHHKHLFRCIATFKKLLPFKYFFNLILGLYTTNSSIIHSRLFGFHNHRNNTTVPLN